MQIGENTTRKQMRGAVRQERGVGLSSERPLPMTGGRSAARGVAGSCDALLSSPRSPGDEVSMGFSC